MGCLSNMTRKLRHLELVSGSPASWPSMPSVADLKQQIAMAVISDSEITDTAIGFYSPPKRIRNVRISDAALDQIACMWHGHRKAGSSSPPAIPLKYFVKGFGQVPSDTWADVEVLPGVDSWELSEE